MIKIGILGATGYTGVELMRILANHPFAKVVSSTSRSYAGSRYGDVFGNFQHCDNICTDENIYSLATVCDVIFIALPHGVASKMINADLLSKVKIIDLGADFRLKDADIYEKWYNTKHESKDLLKKAVYGLSEINREYIMSAILLANPGCYTTCSILSLYPLLKENVIDPQSIIIDAKSGVSGAGRGVSLDVHYCETNENIKAYKIATHRHIPEIEEQLSYAAGTDLKVTFTPHLTPMNRGILATCYGNLRNSISYENISEIYNNYYGKEYFIRLTKHGVYPEVKWVRCSNFADIGFCIDERTNRIIIVGAIDNLVKGAAGQAVQNMNIMFGFDEKTGLDYIPLFP